jgi:cytoskeletal protein RodZ
MMHRRERARLLLRGLAKLLAVIVVAGLIGVGLGIALSKLSGDDDPVAPATTVPAQSTTTTAAPAPAPVPAATTTTPTRTTTTPTTPPPSPPSPAPRPAADQIEVTVRFAVLQLATTPSGKRRNRARLGVQVTVRNRGSQRVTLPRPSLLAARQRIPTNPAADARGGRLGPIPARQTRRVTLQFETAGAVTRQLTTKRKARVLIGGRSSTVTVTPSPAVSGGAQPRVIGP